MELVAQNVPGDGNCMFHAAAASVPGMDAARLRAQITEYMETHLDAPLHGMPLKTWIEMLGEGAPAAYIARMKRSGVWGGACEIAVLAELLHRPVGVYIPSRGPDGLQCSRSIEFLPDEEEARQAPPLFLLYVGRNHYMALHLRERKAAQ